MGSVVGRVSEETPKFDVVRRAATYEVRRYAAGVAAESGDADGRAFGHLAKYIGVMAAPQNDRREAIAMTTPVVTSYPTGAMAFLLPSALATAPSPTSDAVSLRSRPETTMAVAAYVGGWDEADAARRAAALREAAAADGLAVGDGWEWRRFNPPWTLPFLKKNEICVPLVGDGGGGG